MVSRKKQVKAIAKIKYKLSVHGLLQDVSSVQFLFI